MVKDHILHLFCVVEIWILFQVGRNMTGPISFLRGVTVGRVLFPDEGEELPVGTAALLPTGQFGLCVKD